MRRIYSTAITDATSGRNFSQKWKREREREKETKKWRSVKAQLAALFHRRGSSVKAAERSTAFSLATSTTPTTTRSLSWNACLPRRYTRLFACTLSLQSAITPKKRTRRDRTCRKFRLSVRFIYFSTNSPRHTLSPKSFSLFMLITTEKNRG